MPLIAANMLIINAQYFTAFLCLSNLDVLLYAFLEFAFDIT
jgi:hypothetical protein